MTNLTAPTPTLADSAKCSWFGYAAALWALIFAALHVAWALGWYVGLDHESARQAFQRRWFLVYDLVAAGLCMVAFAVALELARRWRPTPPHLLIGKLAWAGTALLAFRGGAGVAQDVYLASFGGNLRAAAVLWDVWFCVGAMLFGISAWQFRRAAREVERTDCETLPSKTTKAEMARRR
jgi:Protein of unknown function (DUF3995)